jgi:hypothetical protein
MVRTLNPVFIAVGICSLLSSLDKMGVTPTLVARQTSKVIGPVLADFGKMTIGTTKMEAPTLNEFVAGLKMALKMGGLADPDALEMSKTAEGFTVKWVDCGLKDMANAAKLFGYHDCPLCLPGVIVAGLLGSYQVADVREMKVEKDGNTCMMHIQI